ncbi:Nonribosomal peptide synthetase [Penicillium alfredii]|uniref:Nonribosomal peptide synthetase n=1 Tax=Penicillium alfredii TaxID=1506179 RepID=A0A9W9FKT3_9EURO|nr:Nonribosomal peptide synthetase [Penicillium alfredii]KAJ5101974.1 Nonribosomal peptide synthetase [Penicillium alfredii]
MEPITVMSRDEVDEKTLSEIADTCDVSVDQIEDIYSCTPLQISTIAESAIHTGASVFRFFFTLAPSVDVDRFCAALARVSSLNAILRTRLVDCRFGLLQVVSREEHCTERYSGDIGEYIHQEKESSLELGRPLFRSAIIDRKLVLTMHHAVMDHASLTPLFRDTFCAYHGYDPMRRETFKEFVAHCLSIDESVAKSFWASRFKGASAVFPAVFPGHVPHATNRMTRKVILSGIGTEVPLTHVPSLIESAWALTAAAYTDSKSVAFGLILSGRSPALKGLETTLGPTIATASVQISLQRNMTVEGILKERNTALRELQLHSALQYGTARIRTVSEAARTASSFQTLLNIRPRWYDPNESTEIMYDHMDEPHPAFGLFISCDLLSDGILIEAKSDPAIVCERQLRRILYQFEHTLRSLIAAPPQTKIEKLLLFNPDDRSEILEWNINLAPSVEKCLHELFSAQAREQPDAPAVEAGDGTVSYCKLDALSNRLAHELRRRGVTAECPVAFIFEKSLWTVVAVLAIMKAGGACVPIERSDPRARKETIISSTNAKTILTSSAEHANTVGLAPSVICVSAESVSKLPDVTTPLDNESSNPESLAYIMFTSGSTGVPKGVMLEHRCLVSSLTSLAQRFDWRPGSRILQFAAHVWDISMGETYGALLFGGCLCIPSEEARESNLAHFIESSKVNWAWLTPTVLRTLSPDDVPSLESLLSIGEPISAGAAKTWGRSLRLHNGWGPCEASILSTVAELKPDCRYPESIGTPVGCAIWIVNSGKANELAPIGAVGEVLVEGPGVARGYLNDKVKTAASFITSPSWAPSRKTPTRFYRTGDLAKYNPDGSICFIGRQDNQVKIRGQRFELGELEGVLASCSEVRDVFATTKIAAGRTELVAVICSADLQLPRGRALKGISAELSAPHLFAVRDYARARLPSYMVPTIWLAVEQMPLTTSAKLDRTSISNWLKTKDLSSAKAALGSQAAAKLTTPVTREEKLLQSIWSSMLVIPEQEIGRESSFVQLGGDSILAMQVSSRCRKHGLRTTTAALLKSDCLATVARLSSAVETDLDFGASSRTGSQNNPENGINNAGFEALDALTTRLSHLSLPEAHLRRENIESVCFATDSQAVMLALGEVGEKAYYIDFSLQFTPALDASRLRNACEQVIQHHPMLRTVFFQHGSALYQAVTKDLPAEMIINEKGKSARTVAFPGSASLARFHLFTDDQTCHRLRLELHHALYDAISIGLIFQDLDVAYTGNTLSHGPSFHSWILHVGSLDQSEARQYWKDLLQGASIPDLIPPLESPIRGHPLKEEVRIRVPLRNLHTQFGTPSSVLKAAWSLLLSGALGTNDVVFGEVSANRYLPFAEIERVSGPCVNTLPVRARLGQQMTLCSLITQIQDQSIAGLPYHHLGFRSLIKDCTTWPPWMRFSSALVYQNHGSFDSSLEIGGSCCELSSEGTLGEAADIFAIATPIAESLQIELRYSSNILPSMQINWISQSLAMILEGMPSNMNQSLGHVQNSLQDTLGSYVMPLVCPAPSSDLVNGSSQSPSARAEELVSQAWGDVGLLSADKSQDSLMFSCGADVVTALLLSEYYRSCGHDISTDEVIWHPSRAMQAQLVESKFLKSKVV